MNFVSKQFMDIDIIYVKPLSLYLFPFIFIDKRNAWRINVLKYESSTWAVADSSFSPLICCAN